MQGWLNVNPKNINYCFDGLEDWSTTPICAKPKSHLASDKYPQQTDYKVKPPYTNKDCMRKSMANILKDETLIYFSIVANDVKYAFMWLLAFCASPFKMCPC